MPDSSQRVAQALLESDPRTAQLRSYTPSLRERVGNAIYDTASLFGLRSTANRMRNEGQAAMDFIPGVGEAVGLDDARRDFGAGNYGAAVAGLGLTAVGSLPGAGDLLSSGMKTFSSQPIASFSALRSAIEPHGDAFVRWSRGPRFDLIAGAKSLDQVTGNYHEGLSSMPIDLSDPDHSLAKILREYEFLRLKDKKISPHIYTGKRLGFDSDGGSSISPEKYLGTLDEKFVKFISDDNVLERMSLVEQINQGRRALEHYQKFPPSFIPIWNADVVQEIESRLKALGGPVGPDFL